MDACIRRSRVTRPGLLGSLRSHLGSLTLIVDPLVRPTWENTRGQTHDHLDLEKAKHLNLRHFGGKSKDIGDFFEEHAAQRVQS